MKGELAMHRLLIILSVTLILFGCGSASNLEIRSPGTNAVQSGDYIFMLTVNDTSKSKFLLSAELRYEGAEEQVEIFHSTEIVSYEIFDQDNNVIYSEFPTDAAAQTTLIRGEGAPSQMNATLSDLPDAGEYTVVATAKFTDSVSNKKYEMENTISFEVE